MREQLIRDKNNERSKQVSSSGINRNSRSSNIKVFRVNFGLFSRINQIFYYYLVNNCF